MKKKSKKLLLLLMGIFSLNLLPINTFAADTILNANTSNTTESVNISRTYLKDRPELLMSKYINKYKVNIKEYETNGGHIYESLLSKAFDNNWETFWQTGNNDIISEVTVTFDNVYDISKILYSSRSDLAEAEGYPTKLKIMASQTENENDFVDVATYSSEMTKDKVVFKLSKSIKAKRIKFVFEEVCTIGWASIAELMFLKEDLVLDSVDNMFVDNEYSDIKEEYKDAKVLENLENQAQSHELKDYLMKRINLAKCILSGEGNKEELIKNLIDFPIHVIQKKGPDNEKNVFLFLAEGYTEAEQDKFISDLQSRVDKLLTIEPFSDYKDEFNIYAMKVSSNESGVGRAGRYGEDKDTYFKIKFNAFGIDRYPNFFDDGYDKAKRLIREFEDIYLDEGGKVFQSDVLLNSDYYGGSGAQIAICSLASEYTMLAHESAHGFAKLADEYYGDSINTGINKSYTNDPDKIAWKEFLGFRGVGIVPIGDGAYRPADNCLMSNMSYYGFCEVCELEIATAFNKNIKNKRDMYIADPITTIKLEGEGYNSGKEITDSNIIEAQGKKLEYRTVVKNFTTANKNVELLFTIKSKDGEVKHTVSKEFIVKPDEVKSLQVVTNQLSDLTSEDKIEAKVIQKESTTIEKSDPPVINGATNITIKVGQVDNFNLLSGITVTDDHDKNLVATTSGTINKPSPGTNLDSEITYTVEDSDGNITNVVRTITVTNQLPRIEGLNDITIKKGEAFDLRAGVTANDNEDGIISDRIVFPNVNLSTLNVGKHEITYTVTDSDNNTVTKTRVVNVEVKQEIKPDANGLLYQTHVEDYGWQEWKSNGEMSGTSGESKRLEGIRIKINDILPEASIKYRTHVQDYGWQEWKSNGEMSGTSGEAKRLEGIEIKLENAPGYSIEYRTHVQDYGWQEWKSNGEMSGTSGESKRLEGIEIRIVKK